MVSFVCASDIHCYFDKLATFPAGDVLILAGDMLSAGTLEELYEFNKALRLVQKKYKRILYTPGNHCRIVEKDEALAREVLSACELVINESIEVFGKKIYMTPMTPRYGRWSFMAEELTLAYKYFNLIPEGLDLLVCHGMPYMVLDETLYGERVGSKALRDRILAMKKKPAYFIGGHIHADYLNSSYPKNYGMVDLNGTKCYNVSICDEKYRPVNNCLELEI